jgi:CHAD domain-containing protein
MKASTTLAIRNLCDQFDNESVHTEHVTALALRLFDATRHRLGFTDADRVILETAARLHDVGYTTDPVHHPVASANITLDHRFPGLNDTQRRYAAAVILFHSGNWRATQTHPLVVGLPQPTRVLRLGALLRVADGLDWGHIQDVVITDVRVTENAIIVEVHAPYFPFNVDRANQKADLWRSVLPLGIQFKPTPANSAPTPPPFITAETHLMEAARRLLARQYKTFLAHVEGAIDGQDIEHLHEIRLAIRRLRSLMRLFRRHLPDTLADPADDSLRTLAHDLGPARDADVWVDFLHGKNRQLGLDANRLWRTFLEHHTRRQQRHHATVRRCLRSRAVVTLRRHMAELLRVELPRRTRQPAPVDLVKFAGQKLRKQVKTARKLKGLRKHDDPSSLHRLRIALRKARYLGEFFAPTLGKPTEKLTRRLKQMEQALGRIHDIDVALDHLHRDGPPPPRVLMSSLKSERLKHRHDIDRAWRRLKAASR